MSLLACLFLSIGLLNRIWSKIGESLCPVEVYSLRNTAKRRKTPLSPSSPQTKAQRRSYQPPPFPSHHFKRHDLSAVVVLRLFSGDALHFDRTDLKQWMTYMKYAGVDHFYIYDNCLRESECQREYLAQRSDVTYVQWSHSDYMSFQTPAYNHHLQTHLPRSKFETLLDIDEFPFMAQDSEPGFLKRHVLRRNDPQLLVRTLFFGGPPSNPHSQSSPWRVARYTHRREHAEIESRTKPIYQPDLVDSRGSTNLHEMRLRYVEPSERRTAAAEVLSDDPNVSLYDKYMGYDMAEDPNVLRFNHYWCERFADPLPVEDDSMIQLVAKVEKWAKERERERERTKVN